MIATLKRPPMLLGAIMATAVALTACAGPASVGDRDPSQEFTSAPPPTATETAADSVIASEASDRSPTPSEAEIYALITPEGATDEADVERDEPSESVLIDSDRSGQRLTTPCEGAVWPCGSAETFELTVREFEASVGWDTIVGQVPEIVQIVSSEDGSGANVIMFDGDGQILGAVWVGNVRQPDGRFAIGRLDLSIYERDYLTSFGVLLDDPPVRYGSRDAVNGRVAGSPAQLDVTASPQEIMVSFGVDEPSPYVTRGSLRLAFEERTQSAIRNTLTIELVLTGDSYDFDLRLTADDG